jgi:Cu/Ag efflux protein CusF
MSLVTRARRVPALVWVFSIAFSLSVVWVGAVFAGLRFNSAAAAEACVTNTYRTRGVVRSFGPNRAYVSIAHEKIDGYMEAMTMSFEPRRANQLAAVSVGDKVSFSFTETEDGRRLLNFITKE